MDSLEIELVKYIPEKLSINVLYISYDSECCSHVCPCGCGNEVFIPFNQDGWVLTKNNDKYTLSPSLLNRICKAHYFIIDNKIQWCL